MTQLQRELYLTEVNQKITALISKKFPDQPRIDSLRQERNAVLADYVAGGGTGWFGNA